MTAMEKKDKNLNVPNLRFPEFSGEWEKGTLQSVATLSKGTGISKDQLSEDGQPCILYGELYTKYKSEIIDVIISKTDIDSQKLVRSQTNDVIIPCSGESAVDIATARCVKQSDVLLGGDLNIIRLKGEHDGSFFAYQLNGKRKYDIAKVAQGVSVVHLYGEHLKGVKVDYPSAAEQKKISSLLALIDQRIETQKKIIEDLKKLKDAIAEKLFCCPDDESPGLRVENSSDRWNLYRLKDVCQRITERNSQESSSLVLTIAAQYGLVSQTDFFNKSVASENLSNYYLIRKGDFAYNKSYSGEYAWGAVKRLELYEKGVLSPLYICFRPNPLIVYSDFLSHYFETHKWHNGIAQIAGEGARNHGLLNISISDFFETIHRFPELPEQQRIASYLNSLSDKISLANKVLESYTRQKQYLLARMFI